MIITPIVVPLSRAALGPMTTPTDSIRRAEEIERHLPCAEKEVDDVREQ